MMCSLHVLIIHGSQFLLTLFRVIHVYRWSNLKSSHFLWAVGSWSTSDLCLLSCWLQTSGRRLIPLITEHKTPTPTHAKIIIIIFFCVYFYRDLMIFLRPLLCIRTHFLTSPEAPFSSSAPRPLWLLLTTVGMAPDSGERSSSSASWLHMDSSFRIAESRNFLSNENIQHLKSRK